MHAMVIALITVAAWVTAGAFTRLGQAREDLRGAVEKIGELKALIRVLLVRMSIASAIFCWSYSRVRTLTAPGIGRRGMPHLKEPASAIGEQWASNFHTVNSYTSWGASAKQ